jgi:hypothetical protein
MGMNTTEPETPVQIPWYAESALIGPGRVYATGSLAQCLRKWNRLPEVAQTTAHIEVAEGPYKRNRLEQNQIAALAGHPDLRRV